MEIPVLKRINIEPYTNYDALKEIASHLDTIEFRKVKTRYGGDHWSAVSYYGYGNDPWDILKPGVLKSGISEDAVLQHTTLKEEEVMEPIEEILKKIPAKFDRVRFMFLKAGTVVGKHTDKVDKDIGLELGKIIRLHVPIRTHSEVKFNVWNGKTKETLIMVEGQYYYIDATKSHSVENNSDVDRIHLVVDCHCDDTLKNLVINDSSF
jgi:hypothetical protein|tara:strand:+ start:4250 stop:4873 length:624 start_codon:yes stop_codon:yes gene_type:complete